MARSACLIFNPAAGQGDPDQDLATIRSILEPQLDLEIRLTKEGTEATQFAREAISRGVEAIIAAGGDGTLSAVAAPLVGTTTPLGIISRGTANSFARALGIPDAVAAACRTITEGTTRTVDVALCNQRPMLLMVTLGFAAEAIEQADRQTKDRFGIVAYILGGLTQLANLPTFEARIKTEDKDITVAASAITVANAAPSTSFLAQGPDRVIYDDGLLDLTIVAPSNLLSAIAASYELLQSALSGEAADRQEIGYLRAKRFTIETNPPQKVALDGESIGTPSVEVECVPGGLTVFTPLTEASSPPEKLEGLPRLVIESKP